MKVTVTATRIAHQALYKKIPQSLSRLFFFSSPSTSLQFNCEPTDYLYIHPLRMFRLTVYLTMMLYLLPSHFLILNLFPKPSCPPLVLPLLHLLLRQVVKTQRRAPATALLFLPLLPATARHQRRQRGRQLFAVLLLQAPPRRPTSSTGWVCPLAISARRSPTRTAGRRPTLSWTAIRTSW